MPDRIAAKMSDCFSEQTLSDLLTGGLSGPALASAEQHLSDCAACAKQLARRAPTGLSPNTSLPTQLGPGVAARVHQANAARDPEPGPSSPESDPDPEEPDSQQGPSASLREGTILRDTYRIVRQIDKGGMGEVYEASHARLAGRYAVKVLPPEFAANKTKLLRFRREAQIASGLQHPNIVQVIDFHETDEGRPYLVMEYLDGENLAKVQASHGRFSATEALPILQQIAAALGAVHRKGIVHRDIKPQNVLVIPQQDGPPLVKLLDFGISKASAAVSVVTRQPALMGTPQYMAPEQALRRLEDIGPATDQFALALIAYEMLTGKAAFDGPLVSVVLFQIVHEPPPPMGDDSRFVRIEPVLLRALAKDPGERFASMAEFTAALTAAVHPDAVSAPGLRIRAKPQTLGPMAWTASVLPRSRSALSATALVGVVIAAAVLSTVLRNRSSGPKMRSTAADFVPRPSASQAVTPEPENLGTRSPVAPSEEPSLVVSSGSGSLPSVSASAPRPPTPITSSGEPRISSGEPRIVRPMLAQQRRRAAVRSPGDGKSDGARAFPDADLSAPAPAPGPVPAPSIETNTDAPPRATPTQEPRPKAVQRLVEDL